MRRVLSCVLLLHILHVPIPFPDLDGECRGATISSLFEGHAWHVLLIGVRPQDDIDRGPIHTSQDPTKPTRDEPAFGDWAISAAPGITWGSIDTIVAWAPADLLDVRLSEWDSSAEEILQQDLIWPTARRARIRFHSWLV